MKDQGIRFFVENPIVNIFIYIINWRHKFCLFTTLRNFAFASHILFNHLLLLPHSTLLLSKVFAHIYISHHGTESFISVFKIIIVIPWLCCTVFFKEKIKLVEVIVSLWWCWYCGRFAFKCSLSILRKKEIRSYIMHVCIWSVNSLTNDQIYNFLLILVVRP